MQAITSINTRTDYYPFGWKLPGRNQQGAEAYRYGYQGQFAEEDKETCWVQFEARMYDARVGRWNAVDPLYQFASPYLGMGNSPIRGVDPDGRDVIFLSTKNAAIGFGHNAVIIGNDNDGWYYYSVNGPDKPWLWGKNNKNDNGVLLSPGTVQELVAQARNSEKINHNYTWDSYIHLTTSPEEDVVLKEMAAKYAGNKHYDVCNDSCLDLVQGVARSFLQNRAAEYSSYNYGRGAVDAEHKFPYQFTPKNFLNNLDQIFNNINRRLENNSSPRVPKVKHKKNIYREPSRVRVPRPDDPKN